VLDDALRQVAVALTLALALALALTLAPAPALALALALALPYCNPKPNRHCQGHAETAAFLRGQGAKRGRRLQQQSKACVLL